MFPRFQKKKKKIVKTIASKQFKTAKMLALEKLDLLRSFNQASNDIISHFFTSNESFKRYIKLNSHL